MKRSQGFTLLEVLVALAVLAIAMGAIIRIATQSVNTTGALRDQTFASWVAINKINELLLSPDPWPVEGGHKGNSEMANRTWFWETQFQKTLDVDLIGLKVVVRPYEGGPVLSTLTALKGRPQKDAPKTEDAAAEAASTDQSSQDQQPPEQPSTNRQPSP